MKIQLGVAILIVVCVGLSVALVVAKKQADTQQKKDADTILYFSNQLTTASASLDEFRQVNLMLTNDLNVGRQALMTLSNQYVAASALLSDTKTVLKTAQYQIKSLEVQNQALDQRAAEMSNAIANLSAQIAETQKKLVGSETNNTFLENELKRQVAKKAELEHKFNNLSQVRAQFKRLQDDLVVARRLEWKREGVDLVQQQKGAQLLMTRTSTTNRIIRPPDHNLSVEVSSGGSVRVVSTLTNAPAAPNSLHP
jgi:chromosome segregation ATPase